MSASREGKEAESVEQENQHWEQWCRQVTALVRFWPDRGAIRRELLAHLEDGSRILEEGGVPAREAQERALTAMGDAEAIGRDLNQTHRPGTGWLWLASKVFLILTICMHLTVWVVFFDDVREDPVGFPNYEDRLLPPGYTTDLGYTPLGEWEAVVEGDTGDGFRLIKPRAAYWATPEGYELRLVLEFRADRFWESPETMMQFSRAVSDWGNLKNSKGIHDDGVFYSGTDRFCHFGNRHSYRGVLHSAAPIQWFEVGYTSPDGSAWTLRLEPPGGMAT